jgi:hypothetical protein
MGAAIDKDVGAYIQGMFDRSPYPEIVYRSCDGLLAFVRTKGKDRLINACRRGLYYQNFGYSVIKNILQKGLDMQPLEEEVSQGQLPLHENIRGADYYK